ncbi:MAG TPA: lipid carrier--UDP-N-acetylgalactosaminyltransferase, partial [Nitrospiraceae bacterium]|nr:lipid carrier--UDP-N-acetylgalactosaminyltransferase [Nitrospiraceae bacterium]
MKRIFDVVMALLLLCFLALPMAIVTIIIKMTSKGHVLHWSDRVGFNNTSFKMPKFRT